MTVRFRSKQELATIKKAARIEGLSFNTFVIGRVFIEAGLVIKSQISSSITSAVEAIEER